MGTDLETTLELLKELEGQIHYWFTCAEVHSDSVLMKIEEIRQTLRELGEEKA